MRTILVSCIMAALAVVAVPVTSFAQVAVSVTVNAAPPPLPVYEQPPCPAAGFVWAPGYWAWDGDDYYWVPGTWVEAPAVGLLWTPGWWGWQGGEYLWHAGYWGPQVGFYGGVNYGYGYSGSGYEGGQWRGNQFYYNRTVSNVSNTTNITNVYNQTVVNNTAVTRVSYNGGQGGIAAQPTAEQRAAANAHHEGPTALQSRHQELAAKDRELRASVNGGKPAIAATARPAELSGHGVVAARAAGSPVHSARPQDRGTSRAAAGGQRTAQPEQQQRAAQQEQQQRPPAQQHARSIREAQAPAARGPRASAPEQKTQKSPEQKKPQGPGGPG
jgi:hypothetical protein